MTEDASSVIINDSVFPVIYPVQFSTDPTVGLCEFLLLKVAVDIRTRGARRRIEGAVEFPTVKTRDSKSLQKI